MFSHELIDTYTFEEVPLDRDIYIVDEIYYKDYVEMLFRFINGSEYKNLGFVTPVAARAVKNDLIELSWYANVYDRFHEIAITLPRDKFICCIGSWSSDEKARIFVKSEWLENLHLRSYSIFALIDAANVKIAIEKGKITRCRLISLRDKIDLLAAEYTDISFISFADSLLLKSNWSIGYNKNGTPNSYNPEVFIELSEKINIIYQETLGLNIYSVIAQGSNEYYDDSLLHISSTKNHISLNSLGLPFAQLMEIETTARQAIRSGIHEPAEIYMDEQYFHSLRFIFDFEKNKEPNHPYKPKMMETNSKYYYSSVQRIKENLEPKDE